MAKPVSHGQRHVDDRYVGAERDCGCEQVVADPEPAATCIPSVRSNARHASPAEVEIATLKYIDWFNHRRLYQADGDNSALRTRGRALRSPAAQTR